MKLCNAICAYSCLFVHVWMCQVWLAESRAFPVHVTGSRHAGEGLRHRWTMRVFVQRPRSVGSPALDYGFCTHYQRIDGSIKPVTALTEVRTWYSSTQTYESVKSSGLCVVESLLGMGRECGARTLTCLCFGSGGVLNRAELKESSAEGKGMLRMPLLGSRKDRAKRQKEGMWACRRERHWEWYLKWEER